MTSGTFCLTVLLTGLSTLSAAQTTAVFGSHEEVIVPFDTLDHDLFFAHFRTTPDFDRVRIVGMGEATHGTHEFFALKCETFKYLVLHHGYTVFGIEASFGGCCFINDVLATGGDVDAAMQHFDFWTWRTQEVRELLVWIRDHNRGRPSKEQVRFCGFDMQDMLAPVQYINSTCMDPSEAALATIVKPVTDVSEVELYRRTNDPEVRYRDTLRTVYAEMEHWLAYRSLELGPDSSGSRFRTLRRCASTFRQALGASSGSFAYRDSCMAVNVAAIQQETGAKMFLWAHNGHINLTYSEGTSALMGEPMGGYLKERYADAYLAIGFMFSGGSFQAVKGPNSLSGAALKYVFARRSLYKGLMECQVPEIERNSLSTAFEHTGHNFLFIDLDRTTDALFSTPQRAYDMGAVYMSPRRSSSSISAKQQFNGLVYVRQTTEARPFHVPRR